MSYRNTYRILVKRNRKRKKEMRIGSPYSPVFFSYEMYLRGRRSKA